MSGESESPVPPVNAEEDEMQASDENSPTQILTDATVPSNETPTHILTDATVPSNETDVMASAETNSAFGADTDAVQKSCETDPTQLPPTETAPVDDAEETANVRKFSQTYAESLTSAIEGNSSPAAELAAELEAGETSLRKDADDGNEENPMENEEDDENLVSLEMVVRPSVLQTTEESSNFVHVPARQNREGEMEEENATTRERSCDSGDNAEMVLPTEMILRPSVAAGNFNNSESPNFVHKSIRGDQDEADGDPATDNITRVPAEMVLRSSISVPNEDTANFLHPTRGGNKTTSVDDNELSENESVEAVAIPHHMLIRPSVAAGKFNTEQTANFLQEKKYGMDKVKLKKMQTKDLEEELNTLNNTRGRSGEDGGSGSGGITPPSLRSSVELHKYNTESSKNYVMEIHANHSRVKQKQEVLAGEGVVKSVRVKTTTTENEEGKGSHFDFCIIC